MENKYNNIKVIPIIIVIIALIFNFLPWYKFKEDISSYPLDFAISYLVNDYADIDDDRIDKLADSLSDGGVSLSEAEYAAGIAREALGGALDYFKEWYPDAKEINDINVVLFSINIYTIIYYLSYIFGFLAIYEYITNKNKYLTLPFFIIRIITFLLIFFSTYLIDKNSPLAIRITLWSILALILSVPEFLYGKMNPGISNNISGAAIINKPIITKNNLEPMLKNNLNTWTCLKCGNNNINNAKFCGNCGDRNPNIEKCPNCGLELMNKEKYCPTCGTKIEWRQTEIICPSCGLSNTLNSSYCEGCGTILKENKKVPVANKKNEYKDVDPDIKDIVDLIKDDFLK